MSLDFVLVCAFVGAATGWLVRRWIAVARRRKEGGCAGGCGCATKVGKKG